MNKQDLTDLLLNLDEEASLVLANQNLNPYVVLVGGAAFLLRDLTSREGTLDVDVLEAENSVRNLLKNYPEINGAVAAYSDQIPYNFEDRLVPLELGTSTIQFVSPSTEDLVVMKLYAARPNDLQDVQSAAINNKIDWKLLEHLVYDKDEAKASCLSERRYKEMVIEYEEFKREFRNELDL